MLNELEVGLQNNADGAVVRSRAGRQGDQMVSELHGRFYEQCFRGLLFSGGATQSALSANTITLTATTTPIVGVWNPPNSGVNLVILQATVCVVVAGNSAVAPGGFVWASSIGNNVITTGTLGYNRLTMANSGGQGKFYTPAIALTGLTNNLVIQEGFNGGTLLAAQGATASATFSAQGTENVDGSRIVKPGGVLAILNVTSTTTISVVSQILWEEVVA